MSAAEKLENVIHPTAVIEHPVKLGEGNYIGPHCYIGPHTIIGNGNRLEAHVCIGTPGQYRDRESRGGVSIGHNNVFREFSQVHRAMEDGKFTRVGDRGYFMVNAHIAHDCVIENDVTLCNNVFLGGHVHVMKGATLGAGVNVHQHQTIGAYSMLGLGSVVPKSASIEPGEMYAGNPARHLGRNLHALKKHRVRNIRDEEIRFLARKPEAEEGGIKQAVGELQEYMKSRSRDFQRRRYDIVRKVLPDLPYLRTDDAANVYNMAFSLLWQQHEDFQADQIFIRELLIDTVTGGEMPPKGDPKGGVGWLINHCALGTYAPFKHVYAYLSGMQPCQVFIHGSLREKEAQELVEMGHHVHHIQGTTSGIVDAVADLCKKHNVGALISDIYLATPLWAYMRRVAPLQVYLSPGFQLFPADLVLLPYTQEPIRDAARLREQDYEFIPTAVVPGHLRQPVARKKPGKVFGCLSRAEKCSAEYLRMVAAILDQVPGSEFHFYGRGELDYNHPRFKEKGIANAHEALSQIDVYLDTWPSCSGLSAYEAMAHGVPVVTLNHPSTASWNAFKPCVVNTREAFEAEAIAALGARRVDIIEAGKEAVEKHITNIPSAVAALYEALQAHGWRP